MMDKVRNSIGIGLLSLFVMCGAASSAQDDIMEFEAQYAFGSEQIDFSNVIEYDAEGNIFIYGLFGDDMDCDPTEGEFLLDPQGQPDLFVAKYNSLGETIWAFGLGRIALDNGMNVGGLQVDEDGNVYITGSFSSFVDFDPSETMVILTSLGGQDAFVAKYNSDGGLLWVNQYGTPSPEVSQCAALDDTGNLTFSLRFSEPIDLDLGGGETILTPQGAADVAAVKIDGDGNYLWSHQISSDEGDEITELAYASNGILAIGAEMNGVSNPFYESDMYLVIIAADGTVAWDFDFQNFEQNNQILAFAFDADNSHVYVGGRIQGITDFDPSDGETIIEPFFADPFFSKYNLSTGELIWAKYIESPGIEDYLSGMTEAGSALFVMGSFDVSAKFDTEDFSSQIPSEGGLDIYIAAYDRLTGEYMNAETAGGPGSERSVHANFNANGLVYTTGTYSISLQLDPNVSPIDAIGFADIFFATFNFETTLSLSETEIADAFTIFPVPASNQLNIKWRDYGFNGNVDITATNVVGQTVKEFSVKTALNGVKMDVSDLNAGVYILTFKSDGYVFSKRFVKQ